ncbi:MAG TPA: hypothetical protein ENJ08_15595 [Gammaproteobacteria bacterium]|nr:hypothetical protein [Gammaproteobacteria bacterium]
MKKTLQIIISIFSLISLFAIILLFSNSMLPSERAKAERPSHNIKSLKNGSYILTKLNRKNAWDQHVLIIKNWSGKFFVHIVPTKNGLVTMPDYWWGWGYYHCKNFGPETDENNNIKKQGLILCHDKNINDWEHERWRWTYSGKALSEWVSDIKSPDFEVRGDILYINE